jgi:hypothetical protein
MAAAVSTTLAGSVTGGTASVIVVVAAGSTIVTSMVTTVGSGVERLAFAQEVMKTNKHARLKILL